MELNEALEQDAASSAEVLITLEAIAEQLAALGIKYPNSFEYLSVTAKSTGEMNLQDAAMAIGWALDYLAEGE